MRKCRVLWFGLGLALAGCAPLGGPALRPGQAGATDVLARFGAPAAEWRDPDGSRQWAYPAALYTLMVYFGPDGRLSRLENALAAESFARIRPGMDEAGVVRILGPYRPAWTTYFARRDERVLEWRYCDDWNTVSRFDVMFDHTKGTVRSTYSWQEDCGDRPCWCGRFRP